MEKHQKLGLVVAVALAVGLGALVPATSQGAARVVVESESIGQPKFAGSAVVWGSGDLAGGSLSINQADRAGVRTLHTFPASPARAQLAAIAASREIVAFSHRDQTGGFEDDVSLFGASFGVIQPGRAARTVFSCVGPGPGCRCPIFPEELSYGVAVSGSLVAFTPNACERGVAIYDYAAGGARRALIQKPSRVAGVLLAGRYLAWGTGVTRRGESSGVLTVHDWKRNRRLYRYEIPREANVFTANFDLQADGKLAVAVDYGVRGRKAQRRLGWVSRRGRYHGLRTPVAYGASPIIARNRIAIDARSRKALTIEDGILVTDLAGRWRRVARGEQPRLGDFDGRCVLFKRFPKLLVKSVRNGVGSDEACRGA